MHVVVLAGGVGGSRFVRGVRAAYPEAEISVVVNTADDITLHGLRVCPDLDTMMYTLGAGIDTERGWGRSGETWQVRDELASYGAEAPWFGLGDRDIATHLVRTQLLAGGATLSEATRSLCARWLADDPRLRLLPMTDDPVETEVAIADESGDSGESGESADGSAADGRRFIHFQEYWVRHHAVPDALAMRRVGIEASRPAPGVLAALAEADVVLVAPSNPVVSIGPILAVPGLREALRATPAPVVGFAGILGGAPVLGMAHRLLPVIGVAVDAGAVGLHYGSRSTDGVLDLWVMDGADAGSSAALEAAGLPTAVTGLLMTSPEDTAEFVRLAVKAVRA